MPNPFNSGRLNEAVEANDNLPRPVAPGGEVISALFECYTCYEGVKEATYFARTKVLRWTCSQGHENEERDITIV